MPPAITTTSSGFPYYRFREEGAEVVVAGPAVGRVLGEGRHGTDGLPADITTTIAQIANEKFDCVYLPGGIFGPLELRAHQPALDFVRRAMERQTLVAAIWREVFEAEQSISYPFTDPAPNPLEPVEYWTDDTDYALTYGIDDSADPDNLTNLKKMSWAFWFCQNDPDGLGGLLARNPQTVTTGQIFHNYAAKDYALYGWMRVNDANRIGNLGMFNRNEARFRTLSDGDGDNYSMDRVPALMSYRHYWFWDHYDIALPSGCVPNPIAESTNAPAITNGAWAEGDHAAFRDEPFQKMYSWFDKFLGSARNPLDPADSAVPIGVEK